MPCPFPLFLYQITVLSVSLLVRLSATPVLVCSLYAAFWALEIDIVSYTYRFPVEPKGSACKQIVLN
jgi:hypothetical protein